MPGHDQYGLPVAYYRGGTSKALFFREENLPKPGPQRDEILKRVMGSPDPLQIDGMGGSKAVTSKIAIIKRSARDDADVDYTFAQVGTADNVISYDANCGNISAAVGPFAIDEGLTTYRPGSSGDPQLKAQEVRIYNTGTKKLIISHVPIDDNGYAVSKGNQEISGVPGAGAPILMDYKHTLGATLSKGIFPSGRPVDIVNIAGKDVQVTICDVANWCVFVNASDFGITGHESAAELTANASWIENSQELRGKVGQLLGLTSDWRNWDKVTAFAPLPIIVAPSKRGHISARLFLDKMCHESMAGTGAICATACSRVPGTIVNRVVGGIVEDSFEISHPIGIMTVLVHTENIGNSDAIPEFRTLSFVRTARRIMDGTVYVPKTFMASEDRGDNDLTPQRSEEPPDCLTQDSRPTTSVIAEFVQNTKYADLDESVKMTVKNLILDYIGVACAAVDKAESTEPVYRAISCLQASGGRNTVFKKGQKFLPQYAALLNGFLAHSLDFDDTYAEGVLHAGVTAITAGLVASEVLGTRGDALIEAVAIGYEVTCRIGRALGHGAYSRGFHNTSTAGIFGAVATISKVKGLSTSLIEMAFGLAGSKPAGSMQYLENGSWNKRLHPGFAVHDAWLCVSLAESGVIGAEKIFEGKFGFFNAYTPNKINYEELLDTLGSEWIFLKTIWKPFPACRMTHGLIEAVDEIRRKFSSSSSAKEVKQINVRLPSYQYPIVGLPTPNKVHPLNIVDAQFSAYYQIALSWLHGGYIGWAGYDHLRDSSIHKLAECIHIVDDPGLDRLEQYITLEFTDGTVVTKHIKPKDDGGAGDSSREKIAAKYLGLAGPVYGEEAARQIQNIVYTLERYHVSELMTLVQ